MEAIIFWWPAYRLAGLIKLFTAIISWATVIALVPVVPQALALRSPEELEQEIADRKRAEESLGESEERFRSAFENAAVGIALCDIEGHFLRVNQRFCGIVGYTHEELVGKNYKDITHPDDLLSDPERINLLMQGDLPGYSREKRYIRKDGSLVWAALSASVLQRDLAGRPVNTIVIIQDISERKRLEAELSQAHAQLNLALRSANITILELNMPDGVLENGRWEVVVFADQARGYDSSEWETEFAVAMARVHPEDRKQVERAMRAHLTGQAREYKVECRTQNKEGAYGWILARGMAIRDAEGRAIRLMVATIDITDLKRAEEGFSKPRRRRRRRTGPRTSSWPTSAMRSAPP